MTGTEIPERERMRGASRMVVDAMSGRMVFEVNPGSPGCCYLRLVKQEYWDAVWVSVGATPRLKALFLESRERFLVEDELANLSVGDYGFLLHIVEQTNGNLLSNFRAVAKSREWPIGSLGAWLSSVGSSAIVDAGRLLECGVGTEHTVPLLPVVLDRESVNAYNLAVAAYYRGFPAPKVEGPAELVIAQRMPVGPNHARNVATRERRKLNRLKGAEEKAEKMVAANWRAPARTAEEQKLHELRVKRQVIQEERKLKKLESPEQMVEDAMRQIAFAEKCAKVANNSKVAAWAADLASASAESIARSSGSFGETSEKSGATSEKNKKEKEKFEPKEKKEKGRFASRMHGSREIPLEDLLNGVDSVSGRTIRSDGTFYTRGAAKAWISRYSHLKGLQGENKSEKQRAIESNISVDEVRKYFRLKHEFSL